MENQQLESIKDKISTVSFILGLTFLMNTCGSIIDSSNNQHKIDFSIQNDKLLEQLKQNDSTNKLILEELKKINK